jgi:hypothetical protein
MQFRTDFSKPGLIVVLTKNLFWSGSNVALLLLIRYFDNAFLLSETIISVLLIPIGLVNAAVVVNGFVQLRNFYWKTTLICFISISNFGFFLWVLQSLYSQSGVL